jgi:thiol-disulfide isomerase/thioredoxin
MDGFFTGALCALLMLPSGSGLFGAGISSAAWQSASPAPAPQQVSPDAAPQAQNAEDALDHAISTAGNDRAALVRNLEDYMKRYPDAPRSAAVYRALVESSQQLQDYARALEYAEKLIAIDPDNTEMMMLAVGLLEKQGDDASLQRAVDYLNRVVDRTEKLLPSDRPARVSLESWRDHQKHMLVDLYAIRGRVEFEQKDFPAAIKDLTHSFQLEPNAAAAQKLGEIAEIQHRLPDAVQEYAIAFSLPENGPGGAVDRKLIRQKLGNVWRQSHGNDTGLGDMLLGVYDQVSAPAVADASAAPPNPASRNKDAKDVYAYVLRQLDGTPVPLAPQRGKILVLNFWATWCGPCHELEPLVAQIAQRYADTSGVSVYAVDVDEDQSRVPDFVQREKMKLPVVYGDGLGEFLGVNSIPTVIVLDRSGRIVYSATGASLDGFVEHVSAAVDAALKPAS